MEDGSLFQRMRQLFQNDEKEDEQVAIEAAKLMHNIVRYMDKDAKDIMTHRKNIKALDDTMTLEEAVSFINSLTPESRVFNMMRENLAKLDGGLEILKEYLERLD